MDAATPLKKEEGRRGLEMTEMRVGR